MAFGVNEFVRGGSLGSLIVKISADMRDLDRGLKEAEKTVVTRTQKLNAAISATATAFSALSLAALAASAVSIKAAIDFESAFAGVRKTVDATEEEFAILSKGLQDLSRRIPVAATELARIQELAGQLGVRGVENLQVFTETIAKVAVTTNLTSEEAATSFARIANVIQLPLNQIDRFASAIVELGNNSATTEAEIVSFVNRIAGAGKVVGLSAADIAGIGTAFSSVGVQAERGGTAVSKALIRIGTAVGTANEDLALFAEVAGMSAEEFTKAWENDAARAFAVFIEGLGKSGIKGVRILEELELADQKLIQAFLSVGGAAGILTESVDLANKAFSENNALTIEAEKRFATTASQLKILKNNVVALAVDFGTILLPAVNKAVEAMVIAFQILDGRLRATRESFKEALADANDPALTNLRVKLVETQDRRNTLENRREAGTEGGEVTNQRIRDLLIEEERLRAAIVDRMEMQRVKAEEIKNAEGGSLVPGADAAPELAEENSSIEDDIMAAKLEKFRAFQEEIRALSNEDLQVKLQSFQTELAAKESTEAAKTAIVQREIRARIEMEKLEQQVRQQSFDLARALISGLAGESAAAAMFLKALRIVEIIIEGQRAQAGIDAVWAWNPPVAATLKAKQKVSTILQVATVAAQAITGFNTGTDSVPARLTPGEMVIPTTFAESIRRGRLSLSGPEGGGGRQVTIENIEINVTTESFDETSIPDIIETIGLEIENQSRGA